MNWIAFASGNIHVTCNLLFIALHLIAFLCDFTIAQPFGILKY